MGKAHEHPVFAPVCRCVRPFGAGWSPSPNEGVGTVLPPFGRGCEDERKSGIKPWRHFRRYGQPQLPAVQAVFDLFGIKYTGTDSFSSALAMDKSITKQLFLQNGVPTPASHLLTSKDDPYKPEFPCVVKVSGGGSSVGVYIVQNEKEYADAVQDAFRYDAKVLVEQYIKGREFTDCVIEGKPYPVVEIEPVSGFYDYKNKYQAGSTIETCPAKISDELTKKIQDTALKAYQVLGIKTYARMDVLMDENGDVYCLEANTLPGMTPTSLIPQEAAVLGISYGELCELIIEISLKKYV